MKDIKIPKLFKTTTVKIEDNEIEIKGFRGTDYADLRAINYLGNESVGILAKFNNTIKDKKEKDLTDEEIDKSVELRNQMEDIKYNRMKLIKKISIRALKRSFYPDLSTDEIDKISDNDFELSDEDHEKIFEAMNKVSETDKLGDDEKKKNSPSKKKSKTSEK